MSEASRRALSRSRRVAVAWALGWCAASPLALLQASLGLRFDTVNHAIVMHHPRLPDFLDEVLLRNPPHSAEEVGDEPMQIWAHNCRVLMTRPELFDHHDWMEGGLVRHPRRLGLFNRR